MSRVAPACVNVSLCLCIGSIPVERTVHTFETETQIGRHPATETYAVCCGPLLGCESLVRVARSSIAALNEGLVATGTDLDEPVVTPV